MNNALEKFITELAPEPKVRKVAPKDDRLAKEAIKAMKEIVGHNDAAMGEVLSRLAVRPLRFEITRDKTGDMTTIIPIYERT